MIATHPRSAVLRERCYRQRGWQHAYRHFDQTLGAHLHARAAVLEIGCGRNFPLAARLAARAGRVCGLDPALAPGLDSALDPALGNAAAEAARLPDGVIARRGAAEHIPFADAAFDLVACRSVLEHLPRPAPVFAEIARVLRPGGVFVFLTPSRYDYVSIAARLVPQRWHARILRGLENRAAADTHPTWYRVNTRRAVHCYAVEAGLHVERLEYLNHPPDYFAFNPVLYHLGTTYDSLLTRVDALGFLRGWLLGVLRK
ncbi:MAG: methyltransferase domain-containing protein [Planctomycetota bacterium]